MRCYTTYFTRQTPARSKVECSLKPRRTGAPFHKSPSYNLPSVTCWASAKFAVVSGTFWTFFRQEHAILFSGWTGLAGCFDTRAITKRTDKKQLTFCAERKIIDLSAPQLSNWNSLFSVTTSKRLSQELDAKCAHLRLEYSTSKRSSQELDAKCAHLRLEYSDEWLTTDTSQPPHTHSWYTTRSLNWSPLLPILGRA